MSTAQVKLKPPFPVASNPSLESLFRREDLSVPAKLVLMVLDQAVPPPLAATMMSSTMIANKAARMGLWTCCEALTELSDAEVVDRFPCYPAMRIVIGLNWRCQEKGGAL